MENYQELYEKEKELRQNLEAKILRFANLLEVSSTEIYPKTKLAKKYSQQYNDYFEITNERYNDYFKVIIQK